MAPVASELENGGVFWEGYEDFQRDNENAKKLLKDALSYNQLFLAVGAGSSKRCGYPLWTEFLCDFFSEEIPFDAGSDFEKFFKETVSTDSLNILAYFKDLALRDPLGAASLLESYCASVSTHSFRRYLKKTYSLVKPPGPEHIKMVDLPFRGILTTNYDSLLEGALDKLYSDQIPELTNRREIDIRMHLDGLDGFLHDRTSESFPQRKILHLHGVINDFENCIITKEDYDFAYETEPFKKGDGKYKGLQSHFLRALVSMHRVVFVGFSFTDPVIQKIMQDTSYSYWFDGKPVHFLIDGICREDIPIKKKMAEKLIRYGIKLICFEELKNSFSGFKDAVDFMSSPSRTDESKINAGHETFSAADLASDDEALLQ